MSVKVSVIIPVFNAQTYLSQCIESLINQTLKDCEFIFINDGSKDQSKEIIEKYRDKDSRIKLINQENQGVSIARNNGLKFAFGEYIGFVDADDYVKEDMYKTLYRTANENDFDVVMTNFESEMEGHKVISDYPFPKEEILHKDFIDKEIIPYFLKSDNLNSVVNKLYKSKIIKEKKIEFPDRVALGEDGLFNIRFFNYAEKMMYIEYSGYHYREVEGSATRNILEKDYFSRALEVYHLRVPELNTAKISKERILLLKSIKLVNSVISYLHVYLKPSKQMSFYKRYNYVRNMIRHQNVREALPFYYSEMFPKLGRYERFIVKMIKKKSTMGLFIATSYSRLRNK